MSSFVCASGLCTFTRIDTNAYAVTPPSTYFTNLPKYHDGNITRNQLLTGLDDTSSAPWTDPKNQDRLGKRIALTRDYDGNLRNAFDEYANYGPPGTEWAILPQNQTFPQARCELIYGAFEDRFDIYDKESLSDQKGIVHLIEEDLYYNIRFLSWTQYNGGISQGGFSYVRNKNPIKLPANLPPCTKCDKAVATSPVLLGPVNGTYVPVGITGFTPANATVTIKAVSQDHELTPGGDGEPNAKGLGQSTVLLRRTRVPGRLEGASYTVYYTAATATSKCSNSVRVCVPPSGYTSCEEPYVYGIDATAMAS